jgi:hypothetical protein
VYASVAEVRAEGVSSASAADARVLALIDEATRTIDRVTGQYFESRQATYRFDGRGTPTIELPVPPIRLSSLRVDYEGRQPFPFLSGYPFEFSLDPTSLVIVGAPVRPNFDGARLTMRHGLFFPKGHGNVSAEGAWGYTEDDGTPGGCTPPAVKRACILLVLRGLLPLADDAAFEARSRWRILEERTRDQSYRLDANRGGGLWLTGDPEVDTLLTPYVRVSPLGAA